METEVDQQLGAEKSQRTDGRSGYRSGYRPRRLDTRMGTMYLMVPKVRQGGYIPFLYRKLQKKSGCDKIRDENITAWQTERIGGFATT